VGYLIERVVKGGDCADDPEERLSHGVNASLFTLGADVARKGLAVIIEQKLGAEAEDIAGAAHLVEGVLLTQSCFCGE
jgi:hypothetical protein